VRCSASVWGVLPLKFKRKGGVLQTLSDHVAKIYKVSTPASPAV